MSYYFLRIIRDNDALKQGALCYCEDAMMSRARDRLLISELKLLYYNA